MSLNKVIGLTGKSGAGKGVACDALCEEGCVVIDCDKLAHENMLSNGSAFEPIVKVFGKEILQNGEIDRKKLGDIVFTDKEALDTLNGIAHGIIKDQIQNIIENTDAVVVIDAPQLYEAGLEKLCAECWFIYAAEEIRLERVMLRDNISRERAMLRFNAQLEDSFYFEKADVVIEHNDNDIESFKMRVKKQLHNFIKKL